MDIEQLTTISQEIQELIDEEMRPLSRPIQLGDISRRLAQRSRLGNLRENLHRILYGAIDSLPSLPDPQLIAWARALLSLPNMMVIEVDTTGLGDSEIIRLLLLKPGDQEPTFDRIVRPMQSAYEMSALAYNGLSVEEVERGSELAEIFPLFEEQILGHILLSWNWDWDKSQLRRSARRLGRGEPILIGIDLQDAARGFFERPWASLGALCSLIGSPLIRKAAPDRARGQLAILQAIAAGFKPESDLDLEGDSQPF